MSEADYQGGSVNNVSNAQRFHRPGGKAHRSYHQKDSRTCFFCGKPGHLMAECAGFKKYKQTLAYTTMSPTLPETETAKARGPGREYPG